MSEPAAKTVLVTGGTGLLGREVVRAFTDAQWHVIGIGLTRADVHPFRKLDILQPSLVESALDEVKPDVVIHCAANRFPDSCKEDPHGAFRLNVTASRELARATSARSILLIYISTDYVFPGLPGEAPYSASHPKNPPNIYGKTKADGEEAILAETKNTGLGVVLRVPVLYGKVGGHSGANKESSINILLDSVRFAIESSDTDQTTTVDDWSIRYPTNTQDVARVLLELSNVYLGDAIPDPMTRPKILQFTSEDAMTKYQICQVFAEILHQDISTKLVPLKDDGGSGAVKRPYDCHLSTKELEGLGVNVGTLDFVGWWRRELRAVRH